MDDQEKKQSFIESFEDEGSGLWLPHRPVVIQQPLASPLRSDHSEKPAPVQATTTNETVLEVPEKTAQVSDNLSNTYESSSGNSMDYTDLRWRNTVENEHFQFFSLSYHYENIAESLI